MSLCFLLQGFPATLITDKMLEAVADEMEYYSDLFSKTGCKRVTEKVDLLMEELEWIGVNDAGAEFTRTDL